MSQTPAYSSHSATLQPAPCPGKPWFAVCESKGAPIHAAPQQLILPLDLSACHSGAAKNTQEADELCSTLQKAGVVLRHGSTVYLRADDIAEMVMLVR